MLSWPNVPAIANGQAADLVIGQPDFSCTNANNGGVSAHGLFFPIGVAVDTQGNLYVADFANHRVLEYTAPLTTGMSAQLVFGQGGSFTTTIPNKGGLSANSLTSPQGVALDAQGNLYVGDSGNSRVLEYDTPLIADTTADRVFGQPDFNQNTPNNGGVSANSLNGPVGVALDGTNNLYVADSANSRVLEYDAPLATNAAAARVFGQPDLNSKACDNGGISASSLCLPDGVALDDRGNLYVADTGNNRVLEYNTPLTADTTADRVFGQPDFTSDTANHGGLNANSLVSPVGVALDAQRNLYVTDFNNRVLEYDQPILLLEVFLPLVVR